MHLLTSLLDADPTKAALLRAGLELLAEKGYKGATTREIANRAEVSEVTLFRHYKSKAELLQEAVGQLSPPVEEIIPTETDDLEAAFIYFIGNFQALIEANQGFVIRLLPELIRHPELRGDTGAPGFMRAFAAGTAFIQRYQKAGLLRPDEPPQQMVVALIGPLIARVLLGGAWGVLLPLDLEALVRGFLQGRRADGQR